MENKQWVLIKYLSGAYGVTQHGEIFRWLQYQGQVQIVVEGLSKDEAFALLKLYPDAPASALPEWKKHNLGETK